MAHHSAAFFSNGDFVVVYARGDKNYKVCKLYGQRFDRDCKKVGNEVLIND